MYSHQVLCNLKTLLHGKAGWEVCILPDVSHSALLLVSTSPLSIPKPLPPLSRLLFTLWFCWSQPQIPKLKRTAIRYDSKNQASCFPFLTKVVSFPKKPLSPLWKQWKEPCTFSEQTSASSLFFCHCCRETEGSWVEPWGCNWEGTFSWASPEAPR